ncbi:MAG: hypothetical protein IT393_10905 [Nitrospirae bacterium]|nr:hypothetical protein [Nitrospirota bacterium]
MNIIDIHTHGIGGYDTRTSNPQDILRMAEIQASLGVSAIVPAIYPDAIDVMRNNIIAVKSAMEMQRSKARGSDNLHVRPPEAAILGVHLEGPFLNSKKCGALKSSSFIEPNESNLRKIIDGFEDIVKIITIAPELNGSLKLIKKMSDIGIIASMGHSDATYAEAEAGFKAGARGITHIFNAMRGIHHREPGIAGFGLLNKHIYVEVIADPYHLNEKTLELIFRTKNPDRIILVSDSVKETKTSGANHGHGVMDDAGRLHGGSLTLAESAQRLAELGYYRDIIEGCTDRNPRKYIS